MLCFLSSVPKSAIVLPGANWVGLGINMASFAYDQAMSKAERAAVVLKPATSPARLPITPFRCGQV